MKGKEGSGDPEGREAMSGLASSGRGLDTSGEKGFFADECYRLGPSCSCVPWTNVQCQDPVTQGSV